MGIQQTGRYELSKGVLFPAIGYGTWHLENGQGTVVAVAEALDAGYRLFDCAAIYGNDFSVGKAIMNYGLKREELFITNKLWNTYRKYDDAVMACKRTLKLMRLEYLDSYLIHWPASPKIYPNWAEVNSETWRAMERLYTDGLVRAIGLSNFLPHHIEKLLQGCSIQPMLDQLEIHPGQGQADAVKYCREHGLVVQAWSPLGSGKVLENERLVSLAKKYGKTVAQICIRWCIQKDVVPLPRSSSPIRMRENLDVFGFELSGDDVSEIDMVPYCGGSGLDPDEIICFG